jgi:hypothetical protein
MATAAQNQATPTTSDPVQRWLERRAAVNRANSTHSTGPRTESGKQRSSLNALRHGLTARTALLPTEDPDAYQIHIQQFLDEYKPATPTETNSSTKSPTPPGASTASHSSKPSCSPKTPTPNP